MRAPNLLLIASTLILAFAVASCGGDKPAPGAKQAPASNASSDDSGNSSEELVSAGALLKQSAALTKELSSLSGSFSMVFSVAGQDLSFDGDIAFAEPNSMYMTMDFLGTEAEILMLLPDIYMRMPDEDDWLLLDAAALGIDPEAFKTYLDNRGIIDLQQMTEDLEDARQLPSDNIDGKTYDHYRGTFDFADLAGDASNAPFFTEDLRDLMEGIDGTVFVDTWIDPDTLLPRRVVVDMDISAAALGEGMQMTMTMDFLEFNGDVDIPDRPKDARPISDLADRG